MDTRDWELLLALEEEKSMTKAGERLFLSQPAVVYRLNRMEAEFGTALFLRSNKGVQFTPAGRRLCSYAGEMLQKNSSILQDIRQYGQGLSGSITVGSSSTFLGSFLPGQLKDFYQHFPRISVSLVTERNDTLMDMLNGGQLSVAVVRVDSPWRGPSFHIYDDPLVLIYSRLCSLEELRGVPYIPYGGDAQLLRAIEAWKDSAFPGPVATAMDTTQVTGPQICIQLVKAGLGWSVVPLTRTLQVEGLYKLPIRSPDGRPITRSTYLRYTSEILSVDAYAAYVAHFRDYFSAFSFPQP